MREIQDAWDPIDSDPTMLTLEFMKNGDMHHFIAKLAKANESVPQPILWRIFFCREYARVPACPTSTLPPDARSLIDAVFAVPISRQGLYSDVFTTEVNSTPRRDSAT